MHLLSGAVLFFLSSSTFADLPQFQDDLLYCFSASQKIRAPSAAYTLKIKQVDVRGTKALRFTFLDQTVIPVQSFKGSCIQTVNEGKVAWGCTSEANMHFILQGCPSKLIFQNWNLATLLKRALFEQRSCEASLQSSD